MSMFQIALVGLALGLGCRATAQAPTQPQAAARPLPPSPNDTLTSPRVASDGAVTLSIYAPKAQTVELAGDLATINGQRPLFQRDEVGVWSATLVPGAGTYRYSFIVDGTITLDSRNVQTSRNNLFTRSLLHVPGNPWEDDKAVPHGAIAEIGYPSPAFASPRHMYVYTPPGYQGFDSKRYPVLYLLHGSGDSDEAWSTVGRLGQIIDNLIAGGKAVPMIVVMPSGHVPLGDGTFAGTVSAMSEDPANDKFTDDLLKNIKPFVESRYRTTMMRAIAGLSMGGVQAANIGLTHVDHFPFILMFSTGWSTKINLKFESKWGSNLDADREKVKLLWIGYGETDIARTNAEAAKALFDRHQIRHKTEMIPGAHEWNTWRRLLIDSVPLLFHSD